MSLKVKKMFLVLAMMVALPLLGCDDADREKTKKTLINDIPHTEVVNKIRKEVGDAGCDSVTKRIKRDNCNVGDTHCRIKACSGK